MLTLKQKLVTSLATGAFLTSIVAGSAFAADVTLDVTGNARGSNNTATVDMTSTNTVVQTNATANINSVSVKNNTGSNHANDNAGDGSATGGDATAVVDIVNGGSSNTAVLPCGCDKGGVTVSVSDNARHSTNKGTVKKNSTRTVVQSNYTLNVNAVSVKNKTGKNHANDNFGNGTATGGMADAAVIIRNRANTNTLGL